MIDRRMDRSAVNSDPTPQNRASQQWRDRHGFDNIMSVRELQIEKERAKDRERRESVGASE